MRVQQPWWSVLVAAVLGGLVGVTAAVAGEQFLPVLSTEVSARQVYGFGQFNLQKSGKAVCKQDGNGVRNCPVSVSVPLEVRQ